MSFWMGMALGLFAQQVIFLATPAVAALFSWLTNRQPRRRTRWVIGGVRYVPRTLTRAVMENLTMVHADLSADPLSNLPPFLVAMTGMDEGDDDERRRRHVEREAERLEATYQTVAALIVDESGDSPPVEFLNEHLPVVEAQRIVAEVLS